MTAPDSQLLNLLSVSRLVAVLAETNDCSVICKLQEFDRGVFRGAVVCVEGEKQWGENAALRSSSTDVPPVVNVSTDVPPVAGDAEEILATCTAANAKPAAEVLWSLGALGDSVKVQTNVTVDSEGRSTVKSDLIGVASKDLNQKKVQCLVTHPGLKGKLELNYTLIIHYPPEVVYIISAGDQGKAREFQCEADANPKPTDFIWSR
ncbi:hypothetical protein PDJAM_G00215790 [Pangasius djambal]|uniref:Uncharacterized protein n=1 Tax=Pangasius djambal TaxID=1691987 RepID=A0ACC5YBJ9_9TELE|nr:hypothetical protein [Pangasius djambal]